MSWQFQQYSHRSKSEEILSHIPFLSWGISWFEWMVSWDELTALTDWLHHWHEFYWKTNSSNLFSGEIDLTKFSNLVPHPRNRYRYKNRYRYRYKFPVSPKLVSNPSPLLKKTRDFYFRKKKVDSHPGTQHHNNNELSLMTYPLHHGASII